MLTESFKDMNVVMAGKWGLFMWKIYNWKVETVESVSFLLFSKNEPILETNYDEDDESNDSETTTLLDNSDINNN